MRNKRKKFQEVKNFENVIEWNDPKPKRKVKKLLRSYDYVVLELGCGKGEYTVELAKKYPTKLFIGVDIQGERIWRGAKDSIEQKITNAKFLRTQIENIGEYIPKKSVNEIWLTFPDPYPRDRQAKKRLTSPIFFEIYKKILKKGGVVHLKTDSKELYEYSLESVEGSDFEIEEKIEGIYLEGLDINPDINQIQTTFEKKHLNAGKSIKYLRFS